MFAVLGEFDDLLVETVSAPADAALGAALAPKQLQVNNAPASTVAPTEAVKPLKEVAITVKFPEVELMEHNGFDAKTDP